MTFGQYYRQLRIQKKLTLRKFVLLNNLDVGNHSKLERNLLSPPKSREAIIQYLGYLGITGNSPEYYVHLDKLKDICMYYYVVEIRQRFE